MMLTTTSKLGLLSCILTLIFIVISQIALWGTGTRSLGFEGLGLIPWYAWVIQGAAIVLLVICVRRKD